MIELSQNNYILSLLDIKDKNIIVDDISNFNGSKLVYCHSVRQDDYLCPHCGVIDFHKVKDYKVSSIKLTPINNQLVILKLKKRRLTCSSCGHSFVESFNFIKRNCFISDNLNKLVQVELFSNKSITSIAADHKVSASHAHRQLANVANPDINFHYLPEVLCFDEFKSVKSAAFNMSFIFYDPVKKQIIDVIKDRRLHKLKAHFSKYPRKVRDAVKTIVIDMYAPYISLIKSLFRNALIVFDRFHIIQNINRAFNQIRIKTMNAFSKYSQEYKVLKRYWRLLLCNCDDIDSINFKYFPHFQKHQRQYDVLKFMLSLSPELQIVYDFVQDFKQHAKAQNVDAFLSKSIEDVSNYPQKIQSIIRQMVEYKEYIINAYNTHYNNGCIESCIQKIKLLKRQAFGFKTFYNFRLRILLTFRNTDLYKRIKMDGINTRP